MHARSLVAVLVVLVVGASVASAHGWAVDADPQVVSDGTVVVRQVSMLEGGYLAVHLVEDDEPGAVLGYRRYTDHAEATGVEVALDEAAWADVDGAVELVAVVHDDDGDGEFEWPGDDGIFRPDDPVSDRFAVQKAEGGSARVVGVRHDSDGNVTLPRVDLPADGFVVLYADADGERGEVVGVEPLSAGHHENVTVSIAPRFYNSERSRLDIVAGVHRDDGDGEFRAEDDPAIAVGDTAVISHFDVAKTRRTLPTPSPTATPPPTATGTSSPTATASPTDASTGTATASPTPTDVDQPGFGPLVALVALALLAFGVLGRRR